MNLKKKPVFLLVSIFFFGQILFCSGQTLANGEMIPTTVIANNTNYASTQTLESTKSPIITQETNINSTESKTIVYTSSTIKQSSAELDSIATTSTPSVFITSNKSLVTSTPTQNVTTTTALNNETLTTSANNNSTESGNTSSAITALFTPNVNITTTAVLYNWTLTTSINNSTTESTDITNSSFITTTVSTLNITITPNVTTITTVNNETLTTSINVNFTENTNGTQSAITTTSVSTETYMTPNTSQTTANISMETTKAPTTITQNGTNSTMVTYSGPTESNISTNPTTTNTSVLGDSGNAKESESNSGVILGAVIGSILGIALVCVIAFLCFGGKKTSSFSHRRLYEDVRNEPVLRLDNPRDSFDVRYGESAYYNPSVFEETPYHNARHEEIRMEDIRPSGPIA